jgi:hypothetical protein
MRHIICKGKNMKNIFFVILTFVLTTALNSQAEEPIPTETQAAVSAPTTSTGPSLFFGYSYYRFQLNGQSTANTEYL